LPKRRIGNLSLWPTVHALALTKISLMPSPIGTSAGGSSMEHLEVKRGEIWTVAGGKDYAGKPRPVVILQDDRFDMTDSVTICAFTTDQTDAPLFRIVIEPSESNGLRAVCRLMADKITTVPKAKIGKRIGHLADDDMLRLNRAALVFLGIAATRSRK
jgi:mRNA interferase MazF